MSGKKSEPRQFKEHLCMLTNDERTVYGDEHGISICARGMSVDIPFSDAYSCDEIVELAFWLMRYADWHKKTHQTWLDDETTPKEGGEG